MSDVPRKAEAAGAEAGAAPAKYEKRKAFVHNGQTVYEWEQELEDVHVYVRPPPGVRAKDIDCAIGAQHVRLGLKGLPPFIDEDLAGPVVVGDSLWLMEDGELHIQLHKSAVGATWPAVFVGHEALSEAEQAQVKQKLMLERFQRENPGFDFSGAEFSGQAPDPEKFMGGVDRNRIK